MSKNVTVTFRGKLSYAKLIGDPVLNYNKDGKEWTTDLQIDNDLVKEAKRLGIGDKVRTKETYLDGEPYLTFRHRELRKNGDENGPIPIVDILGNPWDNDKLLGNGTDADIQFVITSGGPRKGIYMRKVRILNLVPYERQDALEKIDKDDPFYKQMKEAQERALLEAQQKAETPAEESEAEDLDDDLPF